MTALEKFKKLPHLTYKYELMSDWGYSPNLYHFDGSWHVTWIHCDDGDAWMIFKEIPQKKQLIKLMNGMKKNLI